jgi:hypothetical protein
MINHARTLLLNSNGFSRPGAGYFMEEYVNPAYAALELTPLLSQVWQPVFQGATDEAYKNWVLNLLMTVLHSTEFEAYIYELDPRVTYLNRPSQTAFETASAVQAVNAEAATGRGNVIGIPQDRSSRIFWHWQLEIVSVAAPFYGVRATLFQPRQQLEQTIQFASGVSEPMSLPGQKEVYFQFKDTMTLGAQWDAIIQTRPVVTLEKLQAAFEQVGSLSALFGSTAPYQTFGDLWNKHEYLNYRMSGYLLALIYRMEELRLA